MNTIVLPINSRNFPAEVLPFEMPIRTTTPTSNWEAAVLVGIEVFLGTEASKGRQVNQGEHIHVPIPSRLACSDLSRN